MQSIEEVAYGKGPVLRRRIEVTAGLDALRKGAA